MPCQSHIGECEREIDPIKKHRIVVLDGPTKLRAVARGCWHEAGKREWVFMRKPSKSLLEPSRAFICPSFSIDAAAAGILHLEHSSSSRRETAIRSDPSPARLWMLSSRPRVEKPSSSPITPASTVPPRCWPTPAPDPAIPEAHSTPIDAQGPSVGGMSALATRSADNAETTCSRTTTQVLCLEKRSKPAIASQTPPPAAPSPQASKPRKRHQRGPKTVLSSTSPASYGRDTHQEGEETAAVRHAPSHRNKDASRCPEREDRINRQTCHAHQAPSMASPVRQSTPSPKRFARPHRPSLSKRWARLIPRRASS